jgi:hypothetical protein
VGSEPSSNVVSLDGRRVEKWEAELIQAEAREREQAEARAELERCRSRLARLDDPDFPVETGRAPGEPGSRLWQRSLLVREIAELEAALA